MSKERLIVFCSGDTLTFSELTSYDDMPILSGMDFEKGGVGESMTDVPCSYPTIEPARYREPPALLKENRKSRRSYHERKARRFKL